LYVNITYLAFGTPAFVVLLTLIGTPAFVVLLMLMLRRWVSGRS